MFQQFPDRPSYSALEAEILDWWRERSIFRRSVEERSADNAYIFHEGPPTVNGNPGIHHIISRTLKDSVCRYHTMLGQRVERKGGWDTHGLPVEIELEKKLGLKEKSEIETKVGVAEFNRLARESVYEHINKPGGWRRLTEQMAYWVDLDDPYITCTNNYIESVWWALSEFWKREMIYRGFKVTPQCPHCETPLSSHELAQGYMDVKDPSLYVKAPLVEGQTLGEAPLPPAAFFLVWTTTPWTLISNVALAVGENIDYTLVHNPATDEHYILAEARRAALDPDGLWQVRGTGSGNQLRGLRYQRLFDDVPVDREAFYVVTGDFVSTEDGTGIVHIAPAFGQDDYEVMRKNDLPMILPVTPGGRFTDAVKRYEGRVVKTLNFGDRVEQGVDKEIVIELKERGLVLKSSNDYLHSYPHCWRCDNPLIYYARDSWYIRTTSYAARMIERNREINWVPEEIGTGRFGNWLEENKDWSLSRDRYWGTPLPLWVNVEDRNDVIAVGSVAELMEGWYEEENGALVPMRDRIDTATDPRNAATTEEGRVVLDLHKPFVDRVVLKRDGNVYRRTPELIDVWFDSGSVPFAQWHYPFENRERVERELTANYISEGIDQTRGWFYTLHAIAVGLFDRTATRNTLVNGHVLDRNGRKMSKRLGNTVDPFEMMNTYGADAVRWYMVTVSPVWKSMNFNPDDIASTVISDFFRALVNTHNFLALYANIDGFTNDELPVPVAERPELDRWILSTLNTTLAEYRGHMDAYDLTRAMRLVSSFTIEQLSNWYVRRSRRRFWRDEMARDKLAAYQTLHQCLISIAKMMAPLAPFISDRIYRWLNIGAQAEPHESVHLTLLPEPDAATIDPALERRMARAQQVVALARMLRERSRIKVRQPLRRLLLPIADESERADYELVEEIIREELNVKGVEYVDAASSDVVRMRAKANFKTLGPRYGKTMKAVAAAVGTMTVPEILALRASGGLTLTRDGDTFALLPEDVEVVVEDIEGWLVAAEGRTTVALDTALDPELIAEGHAREFVNRVQTMRKDAGLELSDRITIAVAADDTTLTQALEAQRDYIMRETLALEITASGNGAMAELEINGLVCRVAIHREGVAG